MTSPMTPGTYLRKRREAAGWTLKEVVCALVCLPDALRPVGGMQMRRLAERLIDAENDEDNLTVAQASLLRRLYPFDLGIYECLELCFHGCAVPVSRICSDCGCSWHDACLTDHGPCAWSETHPELCTACERKAALAAELQPEEPAHG